MTTFIRAFNAAIATFFLVIALTACVSPPPQKLTAGAADKIRRVGVISLVQNAVNATQATGILIFSNEDYVYPVESWQLQKLSEQSAVKGLRDYTKAEVVSLNYNGNAIWSDFLDKSDSPQLVKAYGGYPYIAIKQFIRPVIAGKELDAVIVLLPGFAGRYCEAGRDACRTYGDNGFGIMMFRESPLLDRQSRSYISVYVALLDPEKLEPIAGLHLDEWYPSAVSEIKPSIESYAKPMQDIIRSQIETMLNLYIPAAMDDLELH